MDIHPGTAVIPWSGVRERAPVVIAHARSSVAGRHAGPGARGEPRVLEGPRILEGEFIAGSGANPDQRSRAERIIDAEWRRASAERAAGERHATPALAAASYARNAGLTVHRRNGLDVYA